MENICDFSSNAKKISYLSQRSQIDIQFRELGFSVPSYGKSFKTILNKISGNFKSNNLTAILGPSGAGKSTLLNILAGYKCSNITGDIYINGQPRDIRKFRRVSRYIMQEDLVQEWLTIQESMVFASDLKLGSDLTRRQKLIIIDEVLKMLRLEKVKHTFTSSLSGGEKKRLSIAIELIDNPPVLFLDEPTTGLDELSSSQCITLLKRIAKGGRTVICSIHTPSARLFSMFDHVYVVAKGYCVYQGYGEYVVKFLEEIRLTCPLNYNPADFVIEVSSGEYGDCLEKMISAVANGMVEKWKPLTTNEEDTSCNESQEIVILKHKASPLQLEPKLDFGTHQYEYRSSAWYQFKILMFRMSKQYWRHTSYLWLKVFATMILSLLIGCLYFGMGNDATKILFIYGFCTNCVTFTMYGSMLPELVSFPGEVLLIKREYFNRWYGLKPYFAAAIFSRLIDQLILVIINVAITYPMAGLPLEMKRIFMFFIIILILSMISKAYAIMIASMMNVTNSAFSGPAFSVPLIVLASYGFGFGDFTIELYRKIAMYCDFLRFGVEGLFVTVVGLDRRDLNCPENAGFCMFKKADYFVKMMGMKNVSIPFVFMMLIFFVIVFYACGYHLLRQRLTPNKAFRMFKHIGRLLKSHISG